LIARSGNGPQRPVTLIIPVYRDLTATRDCLESLIGSDLPANASITVINDSSPEDELSAYCLELSERAGFSLIVNEDNLGFVRTANMGFALDPEADILLLNSDTLVSNDWFQRLQSCAYKEKDIGTVTPFSNNGKICSYPVFPVSNKLPLQWTAAELDKAFQLANAGTHCEIPTAVGFCMYIKRSCLNETGPFDEENFGHGYGEECNFSLRSSALGWKHVVAADVFIYHEGGASFASESTQRKRHADQVMTNLHPDYHQLISKFLQSDPLYDARRNVDAIRLREKPEDFDAILEEHFRYTRSILARVAENHEAMISEQEQRQTLERILADNRNQFSETDRALTEAQRVVDDLNEEFNNTIRNMEQSRSWRYTKWLRRTPVHE
jgi:GT2 family glycosyltransferase